MTDQKPRQKIFLNYVFSQKGPSPPQNCLFYCGDYVWASIQIICLIIPIHISNSYQFLGLCIPGIHYSHILPTILFHRLIYPIWWVLPIDLLKLSNLHSKSSRTRPSSRAQHPGQSQRWGRTSLEPQPSPVLPFKHSPASSFPLVSKRSWSTKWVRFMITKSSG